MLKAVKKETAVKVLLSQLQRRIRVFEKEYAMDFRLVEKEILSLPEEKRTKYLLELNGLVL